MPNTIHMRRLNGRINSFTSKNNWNDAILMALVTYLLEKTLQALNF